MRHNNATSGPPAIRKKYKMYGSVLGVAVAALAIDQVLPGPASADASSPAMAATAAVLPTLITAAQDGGASSDRIALSTSLASLVDASSETPDGVNALFRSLETETEAVAISDVTAEPAVPELPELQVASVLVGSGTAIATINGEPAVVGQRFGGWTVTRITRETVTLANGPHTLDLPVQALATK